MKRPHQFKKPRLQGAYVVKAAESRSVRPQLPKETAAESYDDKDLHLRLLRVYEKQIRSENARRQLAYERLPWWRKLVTRRPYARDVMLQRSYNATYAEQLQRRINERR